LEGILIAWLIFLLQRQRQLRREARRAVDQFHALFDLAPFACVVNDQQGRYLMVNQAFCQTTGISREKALGHTSSEVGVVLKKICSPYQTAACRTGTGA
jgi:PAS domain-containing protein